MPTRKTWTQQQWKRPGVTLHRDPGDFFSLDALMLTHDGRTLQRSPAWATKIALPTNFTDPTAAFRDSSTGETMIVGSNQAASMAIVEYSSAWAAGSIINLNTDPNNASSAAPHNIAWWGGFFWAIGDNLEVYRGTAYDAAIASFYTTQWVKMLKPYGEHMYMIDYDGVVFRTNTARSAFEIYLDPIVTLRIIWAGGFHGYLALVAQQTDGTIHIYHIPDNNPIVVPDNSPSTMHEIATIPAPGNPAGVLGLVATAHNDRLYIIPGCHRRSVGGVTYYDYDLWVFDGSTARHISTLRLSAVYYLNLFSWNDRLMLHSFNHTSNVHTVYALIGDTFTPALPTVTEETTIYSPAVHPVGDDLILFTGNVGAHGFQTAGRANLADGSVITSYLDMEYPGQLKRLNKITVLMDGATTNYKVVVSHRIDDTAAWTTDLTTSNTLIPSITFPTTTVFYLLQVRVAIDDDSGSNLDHRILDIAVDYSID